MLLVFLKCAWSAGFPSLFFVSQASSLLTALQISRHSTSFLLEQIEPRQITCFHTLHFTIATFLPSSYSPIVPSKASATVLLDMLLCQSKWADNKIFVLTVLECVGPPRPSWSILAWITVGTYPNRPQDPARLLWYIMPKAWLSVQLVQVLWFRISCSFPSLMRLTVIWVRQVRRTWFGHFSTRLPFWLMQSSLPSEGGDSSTSHESPAFTSFPAQVEFHEPFHGTASVAWTASITNVTTINLGTTISMNGFASEIGLAVELK